MRAAATLLAALLLAAGCQSVATPAASTGTTDAPDGSSDALASPIDGCPVTVFQTIPPNDVVGWQEPMWQEAAPGIWAHPYVASYGLDSGFDPSDPELKILWWLQAQPDEPLEINVVAQADGRVVGAYTFEAPGPGRRDRPTGFGTPPPGCYEIRVTIGAVHGSVVDRVLPP
jgi:hypothetical protein